MSLRFRLTLLFVLATLLPALPAAWVTRDLLHRSLQISQRAEIDDGLAAGLRRSQAEYRRRQEELRDRARRWLSEGADGGQWANVDTRIVRVRGAHREVVQPGAPSLEEEASRERGQVPERHRVQLPGAGSVVWIFTEPVDPLWQQDARATSEALQLVRGFGADRQRIEGAFLLPFVTIYGLGFLFSMTLAIVLARGITRPVSELLVATEDVASGNWKRQVTVSGPRELHRLADEFNRMVNTLDAQNRQLVELETLAGWREMARALAHEVKNPLTPIQLTVEEMWHRYRGDDEQYRQLLQECTRIVVEEVESLREVVGRFREFSRPVELQPTEVDVHELLRDVAAMQKDLTVELDLGADETLYADAQRLRQLLMNLSSNVRQLAEDGRASKMRLRTRVQAGRWVLEVEDDGPGIAVEERTRVFDPYRSGQRGGLGLGLALVKGIVLAHGGEIHVEESTLGGARFVIALPRADTTERGEKIS